MTFHHEVERPKDGVLTVQQIVGDFKHSVSASAVIIVFEDGTSCVLADFHTLSCAPTVEWLRQCLVGATDKLKPMTSEGSA